MIYNNDKICPLIPLQVFKFKYEMEQIKKKYGKQIIDNLSRELKDNYGNGYSRSNLFRMLQFYEAFSRDTIVATLSQQLTWSHIKEIISLDDNLKREFYVTMCSTERWSVRTLRERIGSMMYERTSISKKPEETIGLILCARKSQETVELLELDKSGIHVAQYITQLPPKEVFEEKLHKAIAKARLQLEQRGIKSENDLF